MKPGSPKPQDDRMSHCWSFGSTNHPSSQSRKISVGVLVDSFPKKAFEASKERDIEGNDGERLKSAIVRSSSNGKGVKNKVNSPWVSPKRIYEHGTTSEAVLCADVAGSGRSKLDGVNNARSGLPSDDDRLKRFNGVTYVRKQKKERLAERAQDFTFATTPNPDIETTKNSTEPGTTVGLRLRLQQILRAVSSPNDHHSESPTPELGGNPDHKSNQMGGTGGKPSPDSDKQEQKSDGLFEPTLGSIKQKQKVGSRVFKPRQNSDTIETDSDCPDSGRVDRPVTRSSTRWRAPTKIIKKTAKDDKVKHQEKKISSHAATAGNSSMFTGKKYERKSFKVKPLNLFKEKIQQESVTLPPVKKTSTFGTDHSNSYLTDRERDCGLKSIPNDNFQNARVTDEEDNLDKPFDTPEKRDHEENIGAPSENMGSPPVRRFVDVLPSPTFGINTPASISSPSPTPKTDPIEEIRGQGKTPECYNDEQIESSDNDFQTRKASPAMKESEMEASSDDNSSENSKEDSPSTYDFAAEKLDFMHRPPNKLCNKKQTNTLSPSIKGTRESKWVPNTYEHNEGDGLSRALDIFASELENLRSKVKSASSKRSSEILKSVVADVNLQLQNAETHVQTDMGKLKNVGKLKRKRVETKFEEQEERLQVIYAKFKEEINQHLQDCKSSFEGLEAEQKEFKGTLEKRKSSHRRLVLQVEESVEVQLNEAQKKITAIHEVARKKMAQLKQVLRSCLKDDILG